MEMSFMRLFPASKSKDTPGRRRWPTRSRLAHGLAILLAIGATEAQAACPAGPGETVAAARARYAGDTLLFDVVRNGHRVGAHRVRFHDVDGALRVESHMELRLKLWFIEAYHFRYESSETWCNGQLTSLEANTDDNGTVTRVTARRSEGGLQLTVGANSQPVRDGVYPTTHWNRAALDGTELLNTVTGLVNRVAVGACRAPTPGLARAATCSEFTGDLQAQVWYDASGRWHALAFDGRDGSRIEYRLAAHRTDP